MRKEIRLGGTGGQGMILAGVILAEAATNAGYYVAQSQTYGPEARGGNSACSVVFDDTDVIDFPEVEQPDILVVMSKDAAQQEIPKLKRNGILIVDSSCVKNLPETDAQTYWVPITGIARQDIGREMVANIVALGALTRLTKILSLESMEEAVLARVPPGTIDLNRKAFGAGVAAAEDALRFKQSA